MELEIISETDASLLGRKNLLLKASYIGQPTPKREEFVKEIAKIAKAAEELVVVDKIEQRFGEGARVAASIYQDSESRKRFEKKKGKKEKKKKKAKTEKK
ncbi:MAG: hypothetical protein ABIB71_08600 [Candidatus Woesearchaeota archaeon]